MGKHFSKKSETQEFRNFGNLKCPVFEFWKLRIPDFLIERNDKILNMNLVSIKKHESFFLKNKPTFVFSGNVIPITNQRDLN